MSFEIISGVLLGRMEEQELVLVLVSCCVFCVSLSIIVLIGYKLLKKKNPEATTAPTTSSSTSSSGGTAIQNGESGKTNITGFGQSKGDDNGIGVSGVDLFAHGNAGITFMGRRVYPIAVHQYFASKMLYKVLEVSGTGLKPVLGHVVDYCDAKDGSCNNYKKNNNSFLVDLHKTAFAESGFKDGIVTGEYKVVGEIKPSELPKTVWMKKIQAGKDSILCSCTGKCSGKELKWTKLEQCK